MAALTPEQLLERLAKGRPVPAVLLLGSDAYLRDLCRARLLDAYVPEALREWAVSRFSLRETSLDRVLQQAETRPMLAPQQVVFVDGLEVVVRRLGADEEAEQEDAAAREKRDALLAPLAAYLQDPAPFTVVILEAEQLDQRTRLAKLLNEHALVVAVELPTGDPRASDEEKQKRRQATAAAMTLRMARERGAEIERAAAERLADMLDGDLSCIRNEVEKLALYANGRRITAADVDALVVAEKSYSVWKLAELLAEGSPASRREALVFLNGLVEQGEAPAALVGALAWMYRKLVEAQDLSPHVNKWQAAGRLRMQADAADVAVRQARRIPRRLLLDGLVALAEADNRLKSGVRQDRAVMEFLLARLTGTAARAAAS